MGLEAPVNSDPVAAEVEQDLTREDNNIPKDSQTASDYIDAQLQLEADAREALPYSFDNCTQPLGPLRQTIFACLTCSPPPASAAQVYTPAGVCYSCSISCHGEHTLVELFSRRHFVCDCGSIRLPSTSPCTLRTDPITGTKGVYSQEAAKDNHYNHNFQNHFCGCGEEYDAHQQKGTMFQCLGLGSVESGGCGEDWWHPQCLMGLPKDWFTRRDSKVATIEEASHVAVSGEQQPDGEDEIPNPPGFPHEDNFEAMICYKCVESNPWIKQYAGTPGFLPALFKKDSTSTSTIGTDAKDYMLAAKESHIADNSNQRKRKASIDEDDSRAPSPSKRVKDEIPSTSDTAISSTSGNPQPPHHPKHSALPPPPTGALSLFLKEDFHDHLCHCPTCFPHLLPHPQLIDEEETYEPPLSVSGNGSDAVPGSGARSAGTGSLLERGEAALSGVDRVRAIEGVMVYNNLKEKVKAFLKPYAESGQPVGAEDIKAYFEKLRGDDEAIKQASTMPKASGGGDEEGSGDSRKEQSGY